MDVNLEKGFEFDINCRATNMCRLEGLTNEFRIEEIVVEIVGKSSTDMEWILFSLSRIINVG